MNEIRFSDSDFSQAIEAKIFDEDHNVIANSGRIALYFEGWANKKIEKHKIKLK